MAVKSAKVEQELNFSSKLSRSDDKLAENSLDRDYYGIFISSNVRPNSSTNIWRADKELVQPLTVHNSFVLMAKHICS